MIVELQTKRPEQPRVVDDDDGIITVLLAGGQELRGWTYDSDDERRMKMRLAREYVEGWCDAVEKIYSCLDALLKEADSDLNLH